MMDSWLRPVRNRHWLLNGQTFPPLTTVRQPAAEIGAATANAIIDHLDNDLAQPNAVALKPELMVRASVGEGGTVEAG